MFFPDVFSTPKAGNWKRENIGLPSRCSSFVEYARKILSLPDSPHDVLGAF